jgi:hypothetical protein
VIDRLHACASRANSECPKLRLARSRGDDQTVKGELITLTDCLDRDAAGAEIDIDDFAEDDPRIPLVTENFADWRRDVAFGENPRRDLTQQRLNQVVIRPVDDRDIDIGTPQCFRRREPTESAADNHHVRPAVVETLMMEFQEMVLGARC